VGFTLSADPEIGHPNDMLYLSSVLTPRLGGNFAHSRSLDAGGTATMAHTLTSADPHVLAWADVRYKVTLIAPGHAAQTRDLDRWNKGALLRMLTADAVAGAPGPSGPTRFLPPELANLDYLGKSATPGPVTGAAALFDAAEQWLSGRDLLPSAEERNPWEPGTVYELRKRELHEAQLENYRQLRVARSELNIRGNVEEIRNGGHAIRFRGPDGEFVMLLSAELRGGPGYVKRLSAIQSGGFTNVTAAGAESIARTRQFTAGFIGTIGYPLITSAASAMNLPLPADGVQDLAGLLYGSLAPVDLSGARTWAKSRTAGYGTLSEQGLRPAVDAEPVDVFTVPLRFRLDVYEGAATQPTVRFGGAGPEGDHGADGELTLFVSMHRTLSAEQAAQTEVPHTRRALGQEPLPKGVPVPPDAHIEALAGSSHLIKAFEDVLAGRYDGAAAQPGGPALSGVLAQVPTSLFGSDMFGSDATKAGSLAWQAVRLALSPVALTANAHQIVHGTHVVEHISAAGLIADKHFTIELEASVEPPGPGADVVPERFTATGETATTSSATTATGEAKGLDVGVGGSLTASSVFSMTRAVGPQLRYAYTRQSERSQMDGRATSAGRLVTEDANWFRFRLPVTYRITVRRGLSNLVTDAFGLGGKPAVTLLVRVPGGAALVVNERQLRERRLWEALGHKVFDSPDQAPADGPVRLPEFYLTGGGIGPGAVTNVVPREEARSFGDEVLKVVGRRTPGVLTPGHGAYVPGLKSWLTAMTGPAGLRDLAGRAGDDGQPLHYVYLHAGGAELAEITFAAEPDPAIDLRTVTGRVRPGSRLTNRTTHAGATRREIRAGASSHTVSGGVTGDHPGNPSASFNNKTGFGLSRGVGTTVSDSRESTGPTERTVLSAEETAEFTVPHVYTMTVRLSQLDDTLVTSWLNKVGPAVHDLLRGQRSPGRVLDHAESTADVTLRFARSDTSTTPHPARLTSAVHRADPFTRLPTVVDVPGEHGAGLRQAPSPETSALHGDIVVEGFTARNELRHALREAAPQAFEPGTRLWASPAEANALLTGIFRSGTGRLDIVRGVAVLAADHLAGDVAKRAATLRVTLSGLRLRGPADDTGMALVRSSAGHQSRQAETSGGGSFGVSEVFNTGPFIHSGDGTGLTYTMGQSDDLPPDSTLARQEFQSAGPQPARRRALRPDSAFSRQNDTVGDLPGAGRAGGSWKVTADVVLSVRGVHGVRRWVTGTAYLRLLTEDILGHGLTPPSPAPGNYDLRSVLGAVARAADWRHQGGDTAERVAAYIRADADRSGQRALRMWLDLNGQHEGTAANAMFLAAAVARESGRPAELVLRDGTDVTRLAFGRDGRPSPASDAGAAARDDLASAWDRLHTPLAERAAAQAAIPGLEERLDQLSGAESDLKERVGPERQQLDDHRARNAQIHQRTARLRAAAHAAERALNDDTAQRPGLLDEMRAELREAEQAAAADDAALRERAELFRTLEGLVATASEFRASAESGLESTRQRVAAVTPAVAGRLESAVLTARRVAAYPPTAWQPPARSSAGPRPQRLRIDPVLFDHVFEMSRLLEDKHLTEQARQAAGGAPDITAARLSIIQIGRELARHIGRLVTAERPLAQAQLVIRGSADMSVRNIDDSLAQVIADTLSKRVVLYKQPLNMPTAVCPQRS
jgi:hypothetical protein